MSLLIAAAGKTPSAETHIERHALFGSDWFTNQLLMSIVASTTAIVILLLVAKAMQPRTEEGAKGYLTKGKLGGFFTSFAIIEMEQDLCWKLKWDVFPDPNAILSMSSRPRCTQPNDLRKNINDSCSPSPL